ncbi:alpha-hydroxy-acid oxidizing protein [Enterobacter asburiae]
MQAAAAAYAKGNPFTISTLSVCPLEEVARTIKRRKWFPLYVSLLYSSDGGDDRRFV